jgi:hypothetical protein
MWQGGFMRSGGTTVRLAMLVASAVGLGCPKAESELAPAPEAPFPLVVSIVSDPGHPVGGAKIVFKTKPIATSDSAGVAKVEVAGTEGDTVSLAVQCPEGFVSPEKPLIVGLRHLAPGSPPPKFETRCTPVLRTVVVALRTENGPNIPVMQLGRSIARTDATGVAHFLLHVKPSEQVTLTLDTSAVEMLRPISPTLQFQAKDQDEIVLLEQKFKLEKKKVYVKVAPRPKPL